jgi:Zn ribbon nucleic-acid-binding protein
MIEQSPVVERALDALRAVCASEPEPASRPDVWHAPLTQSALVEHRCVAPSTCGYVGSFPHCPRCASYALYRRNNIGIYGCLMCGLQGIEEKTARRVM